MLDKALFSLLVVGFLLGGCLASSCPDYAAVDWVDATLFGGLPGDGCDVYGRTGELTWYGCGPSAIELNRSAILVHAEGSNQKNGSLFARIESKGRVAESDISKVAGEFAENISKDGVKDVEWHSPYAYCETCGFGMGSFTVLNARPFPEIIARFPPLGEPHAPIAAGKTSSTDAGGGWSILWLPRVKYFDIPLRDGVSGFAYVDAFGLASMSLVSRPGGLDEAAARDVFERSLAMRTTSSPSAVDIRVGCYG